MTRTFDHNGETREISHPEISDEELAEQAASFGWGIDIAARDRILCLAKEKAELASELERWRTLYGADDVEDSIAQDARGNEARLLHDRLNQIRTLSEQRAELVVMLMSLLHAPGGWAHDELDDTCTCRLCVAPKASALLAKHTQPSSEERGK